MQHLTNYLLTLLGSHFSSLIHPGSSATASEETTSLETSNCPYIIH